MGKDPQARGPGQRPSSRILWSPAAGSLRGEACSAQGAGFPGRAALLLLLRALVCRLALQGLLFMGPVSLLPCRPAPGQCGAGLWSPLACSSASLSLSSFCCSAPPGFRKPLTHLTAQLTKAFCSFQWLALVVFIEYLLCVRWSDSGVE